MVKFLTTRGTAAEIETIINAAEKHIYLLSPYVRLADTLLDALKDASRKNVPVVFVYGKKSLSPPVLEQIRQIANAKLFFHRNLHAKCYVNEKTIVISSMNLHDYSESNNKEMGVLINKSADEELYRSALAEVVRIIRSAKRVSLDESQHKIRDFENISDTQKDFVTVNSPAEDNVLKQISKQVALEGRGFCIRCGKRIPANIKVPHCEKCFLSWSQYGKPVFIEKVCHFCGEENATSMKFPFCLKCMYKLDDKLGKFLGV